VLVLAAEVVARYISSSFVGVEAEIAVPFAVPVAVAVGLAVPASEQVHPKKEKSSVHRLLEPSSHWDRFECF
jgi:hypothetical protein